MQTVASPRHLAPRYPGAPRLHSHTSSEPALGFEGPYQPLTPAPNESGVSPIPSPGATGPCPMPLSQRLFCSEPFMSLQGTFGARGLKGSKGEKVSRVWRLWVKNEGHQQGRGGPC